MLWILVRFALIGPAFGALGFVLVDQVLQVASVATSTLAQSSSVSALPATISILWLYGLVLAYPLGTIPALVTGAAFGHVLRRRREHLSAPVRAALGAAFGVSVSLAFGLLFTASLAPPSLLRWAAAGAVGGAVSGTAISATLFAQLRLLGAPSNVA